jgi:hypothetical protein
MSAYSGPEISNDGLVLCLDAANPKSYPGTDTTLSVEVLVVAGGGGGGCGEVNVNGGGGGGGGGGGLIYTPSFTVFNNTSYTVTVGAGGAASTTSSTAGNNGQNSVFGILTAIGGGGGGGGDFEGNNAGAVGGSGGGAGGDGNFGPTIFSAGTPGQGNAGGARNGTTRRAGQGGGGAGLAGQSGSAGPNNTGLGGTGGNGLQYSISGTATHYAGGGGGGASLNFSTGPVNSTAGLGGGGAGGGATQGVAGTVNTGGGGGGGYGTGSGAGGSGIVIIRYLGTQRATGGTITTSGGYTIHTFTTSGTFTPTTWVDVSGQGRNGTLVNAPTFNSTIGGGTFLFNGTNQTADVASLNLQQNFSLEVWVNQNALNGFSIFGQGILSANRGLHIWYITNTTIRFGMFSNDTDFGVSTSIGTWYHMIFTYNASSFVKQLYINAVLLPGVPAQAQTAYIGSGVFRIGATYSSGGAYGNGYFSNVKIYTQVLTAGQVNQNFNALRGRFGI